VNTIRAWLGHASLETTNRYAEITLRTKQAALENADYKVRPTPGFPTTSLALRRLAAELVAIAVTIMWPSCYKPP